MKQSFGFTAAYNQFPHGFNPTHELSLRISDFLLDSCLATHKLILLRDVLVRIECTFESQIEQITQLLIALFLFVFEMRRGFPTVGLYLQFFSVEFSQHVVCPRVGKRQLFDDLFCLFENILFTKVVLARAGPLLLRAVVVVVTFLLLRRDRATALRAGEPSREGKIVLASSAGLAPSLHHLLAFVEEGLAHEWLEASRIQLALHAHEPAVDRVLQHALDTGNGKLFAAPCAESRFRELVTE